MDNDDRHGPRIPAWWLVAALLGGPAIGAGGGAKIAQSFFESGNAHPDVDQALRRLVVLEWRVEILENVLRQEEIDFPRHKLFPAK